MPRLVVITGGPGAGKTALLELVRQSFCAHVRVLPESASILFGGGFPREPSLVGRQAAQRAICRVQRELERWALEEASSGLVLCDRGTIDSLAYWPGEAERFWADVGGSRAGELERYAAVIHLRTPDQQNGYGRSNPLRVESAAEAQQIDLRIAAAWEGHPARFFVDSQARFLDKVDRAMALIREQLPRCCQSGSDLRGREVGT